ncbi:hypothetical protein NKH47_25795 [Mesorhizobium sp. M1060]|uniref:hypothetical protein n=1 Tax=Mesorhizobium sp. M1060 TaxID=2957052 RepID=UPI003339EF7E
MTRAGPLPLSQDDTIVAVIEIWARDIEAYAIHPARVAGSSEHRRAKTVGLDTELLMRAFLGWLRGKNCSMAISTLEEWDERQPDRERQPLAGEHTRLVNLVKAILARFAIRSFH